MKTRLYTALMLLGFVLLAACGGSGAGTADTTDCTLGTSALGSCTLK